MPTYSTAQLKLDTCVLSARVYAHFKCMHKPIIWHFSSLLHMNLSCTKHTRNTSYIRAPHIMSEECTFCQEHMSGRPDCSKVKVVSVLLINTCIDGL